MTILPNNFTDNHNFNTFISSFFKNHDLLVSPSSLTNYTSLIKDVDSHLRDLALDMIQNKLESLDEDFFKSVHRKKSYRVKVKRSRTLLTVFGQLTFTRRIYESKHDGSYYTFVDRKVGLPKYDTYDPTVKAKLCDTYINLGSMLKAGQVVGESMYCSFSTDVVRKNYNISRQTVYNTLKNMRRLQPNIDRKNNTPEVLYIMADEKYVSLQGNAQSKAMVKHAVLFEGFSKVGVRNTLKNKLHFTSLDKDFWEQFHDFIARVYDLDKVKHIVLVGDGATWIKAGARELLNTTFHLDKFHAFQALNLMSKDPIIHYNLRQSLFNDDKETFKLLTRVLRIQNEGNEPRLESINEKKRYILGHWEAIQRTLVSSIICPMEPQISHNLAAIFTSRPKGFGLKNLKRYVSLRDLHLNNVDVQEAYLKTLYYEKTDSTQPIEKEVINLSMFDERSSYDKSSTSNWMKGFIARN